MELRCGKVAEKVNCLLLKRQYTSLGNKLAMRIKRSASVVKTQGAVKTLLPTLPADNFPEYSNQEQHMHPLERYYEPLPQPTNPERFIMNGLKMNRPFKQKTTALPACGQFRRDGPKPSDVF